MVICQFYFFTFFIFAVLAHHDFGPYWAILAHHGVKSSKRSVPTSRDILEKKFIYIFLLEKSVHALRSFGPCNLWSLLLLKRCKVGFMTAWEASEVCSQKTPNPVIFSSRKAFRWVTRKLSDCTDRHCKISRYCMSQISVRK